ncbi:chemotaxis protein MotB [Iodidimonas muriae]|uniref:Chemotaxis protein MotB n=1 Tax=Iodidimonas muriae TaxID=261467 RepID=A0ABQ2LHK1_9PROT|nr:flagellar motor protein MotB [Iodidimonas muriae]GER08587.1 chemotaxis protein MotB [Kordiimonadales bacterium JCM 17843]GGO15537.1 chemotaxis protein MotB [Iodidimonas muriae]
MRPEKEKLIIIRRAKLSDDDEGEHDGVWKIAYADFTTAMMAFFLVLWLATITTESQRDGLTDFFNPVSVSRSNSGGDGVLSGRSTDDRGALTSPNASGTQSLPISAPPVEAPIGSEKRAPYLGDDLSVPEGVEAARDVGEETHEALRDFKMITETGLMEDRNFEELETTLLNAISQDQELANLIAALMFERTPEGLRIQISDMEGFAMFETASAEPSERSRRLLSLVATALMRVPNDIIVEGHTDGAKYANQARGNWELSTGRANAARRLLETGGVDSRRIARVEGMADRDPLIKEQPLDPRNRRIAIQVLRSTPLAIDLLPSLTEKYRR